MLTMHLPADMNKKNKNRTFQGVYLIQSFQLQVYTGEYRMHARGGRVHLKGFVCHGNNIIIAIQQEQGLSLMIMVMIRTTKNIT